MSAYTLPQTSTDPESGSSDIKNEAGEVTKDTWKGRIWDTWDLPRAERRMLFKVDAVLLTLCSVSQYRRKNLDQQNINNAVSKARLVATDSSSLVV
jgi:hypothetical protein